MAGLDPEAIAARKLDIVRRLSEELGLPAKEILDALSDVVPPPTETGPGDVAPELNGGIPGGSLSQETLAGGPPSDDARPPDEGRVEAGPAQPESPAPDRDRGRTKLAAWIALAAVAAAVVVVVLVLLLSGGSSPRSSRPTAEGSTTGSSPPASVGSRQPLKPLSFTAPRATGTITVTRAGARLKLNLTVSGLPAAAAPRYYEVWLYNSIIDSRPLARLEGGVTHLSVTLPADAADYNAIDISLQPPGDHYDSGESVLRAQNPVG